MLVSWISSLSGVSEPALRLLISVLIAYPIVIVYRCAFYHSITKAQTNLYFTLCGILICIFNYGFEVYHSLIAVTFTYAIINLLHKSRFLVPVSFTFHMGYLLIGYYKTATQGYDICWTMCHCVMVLHLIGLTFDVSDSVKTPEVLGISDNRPVLIPNLLEVFSFAYYPPCVIIGPQFSFKRYMSMLDKKFEGTKNMSAGLKRFATGVCYLAVYQGLTILIPDGYFLTEEFLAKNYFMRVFLLSIWGHKTLYKYISCWILSEGAAMCCGLTFVSRDEKTGDEDWSGCANIKLRVFENTYHFHDYISAFNVQTNLWVFQYVFKRLKFLNNKSLSHISALMFLAVWHGFHSGYYMTFFLEFLLVHFEKQLIPFAKGNPKLQAFYNTIHGRIICLMIVKTYTWSIAAYCLVPFVYLSFDRWWAVYKSFYFFGHVVMLPMVPLWLTVCKAIIKALFPLEKKSDDAKTQALPEQSKKVN